MLLFHLPLHEPGSLPWWESTDVCGESGGGAPRTAELTSKASTGMAGVHHQQCLFPAQPHAVRPLDFGVTGEKLIFSDDSKHPQSVLIWYELLTVFSFFSSHLPKITLKTSFPQSCLVCVCAWACVKQKAVETSGRFWTVSWKASHQLLAKITVPGILYTVTLDIQGRWGLQILPCLILYAYVARNNQTFFSRYVYTYL